MGCGNWHSNYIRLHKNIIEGKVSNKQLVVVSIRKGLNDNLTSMLTALYFAILTQRALRFTSVGDLPRFEGALTPRFLDLYSNESNYPPEALDPLRENFNGSFNYDQKRDFSSAIESNKTFSPLYLVNYDAWNFFLHGDLSSYKPQVEYLLYASNRGVSYHLVEDDKSPGNAANRESLHRFGLKHGSNAFLCAFHFLFQPSPEVHRMFWRTWQRLSNPSVLKIGIHIRAGDTEFNAPHDIERGRVEIRKFMPFFRCAKEIEDSRAKPNQSVLWYVLSDSLSVRLAAQELFGRKVLIEMHRAAHPDCIHVQNDCSERARNATMILAIGEMLSFSLADVHVFSRYSGFGRSGAWLSRQPGWERRHLYDPETLFCGLSNFTDPSEDARRWSGV